MKKPTIKITVTKEVTGYSASTLVNGNFIATEAETFEELKANVLEAVNLAFEDKGFIYAVDEIRFSYHLLHLFCLISFAVGAVGLCVSLYNLL